MHHVFAGASFNVNMSNFVRNLKDDKFSLNMNYGFGLSNYQPLLVAGDPNDGIRKNITRQISSGIGFSVTYTAYLFNN
jgi:hypothetical protein